ncbi:MAG: HTH domain-containing protein [Clostridiales bacterium]|nr:HTH domain-containing protein [Clostridiales bacterium]
MKRAVRLLYIVQLLNDRPMTTNELAQRCEVSERTIRKDMLDLQGNPLYLPLILRVRREWKLLGKPAEERKETCQ